MVGSSNSPPNNEEREAEEKQNLEAQSTVHDDGRDNEEVNLPCGYRFSPTDAELIVHYLINMVLGRPTPKNIIKEIDVYACDPDQLPISEFRCGKSNQAYYSTHIQEKNSQGVRPRLITTERGYWSATDEDVGISLSDLIIGFKSIFTFYWGKSPVGGEESGWRMQEYRVNPELFPVYRLVENINKEIEECVICKIRYKELGGGHGLEEESIVQLLAEPNPTEEEDQTGNTTTKEPNSTGKGTGDSER